MICKPPALVRSMVHPRVLAVAGFLAGAVLIGALVDRWLYYWAVDFGRRTEESFREVYLLFRSLGSLPTWLAVAAALALFDGKRLDGALRRRLVRAELLLGSVLAAGLAANVLKEIVRRERPRSTDGAYVFHRPWGEIVSGPGFGMPSGDAAVCFAGVFALCRLVPAGWPVWLLLGCGCAFYRMALGAHFLSDVLVSAAIGWACVELMRRVCRGLDAFGAVRDARPGVRGMAATAGAFAAGLVLWDAVERWRPAAGEDVPGLYETEEPSRRDVTLFFEPDGTYRSVETFTRGAPRLETKEGTWSFDDALLRLDEAEPVPLLASGAQLRLGDHPGALTVRRRSRRLPPAPIAGSSEPPRAEAAGSLGATGGALLQEAPRGSTTPAARDPVASRPPAASGALTPD